MNATQYRTLNDAAYNHDVEDRFHVLGPCNSPDTGKGPFIEIFYARNPSFVCDGIFVEHETHAKLGEVIHTEDWQTKLFMAMQGENWQPNGEGNSLIEIKRLRHTSMSVGDVVVIHPPLSNDTSDELMNYIDTANVETWMVDSRGWKRID